MIGIDPFGSTWTTSMKTVLECHNLALTEAVSVAMIDSMYFYWWQARNDNVDNDNTQSCSAQLACHIAVIQ